MKTITTVREMQAFADRERAAGRRLALVPTMGALHEGHLALVDAARAHADRVVASIFVNPTQFGPGEDFDRYPRPLDADLAALEPHGVDVAFVPTAAEMYPGGPAANRTWVSVEELTERLCGTFRPGHFRGVTTVVAKLLLACKPHVAVFGLKDAQQFFVLRRMARDLLMGVELVGVPTVREPDGLARSSRNRYLTEEERRQAEVVSQAVDVAAQAIREGEQRVGALVEAMRQAVAIAPLARLQYAEVVDVDTLQPPATLTPGQTVLCAVAVFFGSTRLIDNAIVTAPSAPPEPDAEA